MSTFQMKNLVAFFPGAMGYDSAPTIQLLRKAFPDKDCRTVYPSDFGSDTTNHCSVDKMCELIKARYHKDQITLFPAHGAILNRLNNDGYSFLLAVPYDSTEAKEEYMTRYLATDVHPNFIRYVSGRWSSMLQQINDTFDVDDVLWMHPSETLDEALCRTFVPHPLKPFDMSLKGYEDAVCWAQSVGLPIDHIEQQTHGHFSLILAINQLRTQTPMLTHIGAVQQHNTKTTHPNNQGATQ